jgi:fused signal recognition particle receptor
MDALTLVIVVSVIILGFVIGGFVAYTRTKSVKSLSAKPRPGIDYAPGVGDDDTVPRDTSRKTIETITVPEFSHEILADPTTTIEEIQPAVWELEVPEPALGRLRNLRARLARSNSVFSKSLLGLLTKGSLDQQTWDDIEATLLGADLGVTATSELISALKVKIARVNDSSEEFMRAALREELIKLLGPDLDRSLTITAANRPAVILVVGVNGTGKTTTVGKLSRVLISQNKTVLMGAADTFRAAAADQLQTWGDRVGAAVVRGPEGGDPASVAFEACSIARDADVDVVVIDTAGRLHTKTGLMDELGKVKRVIEKQSPVDEVLLVLDATTGQNGLVQAKIFSEVVNVTGIVLTKLDGTAKGGIVVCVQRELGVPVKLVGLGEGPDDLAPFEVEEFVTALLS